VRLFTPFSLSVYVPGGSGAANSITQVRIGAARVIFGGGMRTTVSMPVRMSTPSRTVSMRGGARPGARAGGAARPVVSRAAAVSAAADVSAACAAESAACATLSARSVTTFRAESNTAAGTIRASGTTDESARSTTAVRSSGRQSVATPRSNFTRSPVESIVSSDSMRGPSVSCTKAYSSVVIAESTVTVSESNDSRSPTRRSLSPSLQPRSR
jgi:hypothetical protein